MPRPAALFKQMSSDRRRLAADAFWQSQNDPQEQAAVGRHYLDVVLNGLRAR